MSIPVILSSRPAIVAPERAFRDKIEPAANHVVRRPRPVTTFPRRSLLIRAGDPVDGVHEVLSGTVAISCLMADGRRQLVDIIVPGGFVGTTGQKTVRFDAEALTLVEVRTFTRHEIARDPDLSGRVHADLQGRLDDMYLFATMLGRMTARERVVSFLLRFSSLSNGDRSSVPMIKLPLTRGEIGDYLGLSMETVCRVMTDLARRKLIRIGPRHGQIAILDPARLTACIQDAPI